MQNLKPTEVTQKLTHPQFEFVMTNQPFPAMVAGYGSGKTTAAVHRAFRLKTAYPGQQVGYYLPTYPLINDIVIPRFEEFLSENNIGYTYNKKFNILNIKGQGNIIFRTMDRPERIVGYEHADALADELDTLPTEKAADVWRKIKARNRQKKPDGSPNTIGVATTPEGYRFVYNRWKRDPIPGHELIKASTYSNAHNLPDEYIKDLLNEYPEQLIRAYIEGDFVNLTNQSVYSEFDRVKSATLATIKPNEILRVGMDFNVGKMAAIVHVIRTCPILHKPVAYAVDELTNLLDTPEMITNLKLLYPEHKIIVYPDATGKNRKTNNASETDLALLRDAGFKVFVNNKNPYVKDRVLSFNVLLKQCRYRVNVDRCPVLVEALEKQAYDDKGEPDKTTGHDHPNDAAGYFVMYEFGLTRGKTLQTKLKGV